MPQKNIPPLPDHRDCEVLTGLTVDSVPRNDSLSYCRYCHERLSHAPAAINKEVGKPQRSNRKMVIAGSSLLVSAAAAYLVFK